MLTILYIENAEWDGDKIVTWIQKGLKSQPFLIDRVNTVQGGIDSLYQKNYQVLLLDTDLPDGENVRAFELLANVVPDVPIIVLTEAEDHDLGIQLIDLGAQDYLIRGSLNPSALGRIIEYSLVRKAKERSYVASREAAIRSEEFQSNFLAMMSHEIRTPLSSILGFINLARSPDSSDEQRQHFLEIAENSGELLRNLVNDILELSAIKAGVLNLTPTPVRLRELCENMRQVFMPKAEQKNLQIKVAINQHVPEFFLVDVKRLQQVLVNLLNNAIKFTSKGEITLYLERVEVQVANQVGVRFVIRDTGIGIKSQQLGRLFRQFEQLNRKVQQQYGGTGLGLYISQYIIEKMGGKISVRSQENVGSEFEFTLIAPPVTESLLEADSTENKNKGSQNIDSKDHVSQLKNLRFLVAEDSADIRLMTQYLLKFEGCENIKFVETGLQAFEAFQNEKFDLILMDMQMPELDGYEATRMIRQYEKEKQLNPIPIIAMTGDITTQKINKSKYSGCNEHISKPFKKAILLETIYRCMGW